MSNLPCILHGPAHRVARQFGMDQDVPDYVPRFNYRTKGIAWKNYCRPISDTSLYFPPRHFEGDATTRALCKVVEENSTESSGFCKEHSAKWWKSKVPSFCTSCLIGPFSIIKSLNFPSIFFHSHGS